MHGVAASHFVFGKHAAGEKHMERELRSSAKALNQFVREVYPPQGQ